jgi:tRNA-specific 2-thiouridylase
MPEAPRKKVFVGMSGGVDSSVTAALLLEQGHEVVGAFMKNWTAPSCGWEDERRDALRVAAMLGIPFLTFDFEREYRERVVGYLEREYAAGRTPNPDVLCNREVKFDLFLKEALSRGADMIATGHYARISRGADGKPQLLAAADAGKDQSYFLHQLASSQLEKTLFPIGHLQKDEVRRLARERGLPTADKKDSTGICFVGEVEMREFLRLRIAQRPGPIVTVEGNVVGRHDGIAPFTVGQRHGLGLGGGAPYFVVEKDADRNTLVVARGETHPALFATSLSVDEVHWISGVPSVSEFRCMARIRYRQPLQSCVVTLDGDGTARIVFDQPQRAISPGQFAVLYDGDLCLGGGVIH